MAERKRRILAVNWRDRKNPEAGGAETHLHEILERWAADGDEVTLLCAGFPGGAEEEHYAGLRILRAGNAWNANFALFFRARRLLRQESFDCIVEDVNKIPFFLPLLSSLPHLLLIPHLFGTTVFRETNPLFAFYVWLFELPIPRVYRNSGVIAISPSTRDDLLARGMKRDRVRVSYCGFDSKPYEREDPPEKGKSPRLVHLGRLRKYKGADRVIRSFARIREEMPEARLEIVGDGPELPALRKLSSKLKLDKSVTFHGFMSLEDMVNLLYRCHVFLNSSPKEGWGLTVIEAAACGVPAVASDSPGLRDSVEDGKTGILVPPDDTEAMAEATLELLRSPERREEMADRAAGRAREFSWNRSAREAGELLDRLMESGL